MEAYYLILPRDNNFRVGVIIHNPKPNRRLTEITVVKERYLAYF